MKHALLISGYLRSFKENIHNLKKHLLDINNIDIYIHITKSKEDKYVNSITTIDDVKDLLQPKLILITDNLFFDFSEKINNVINQNYKLFLLNEERKKIEKNENIVYKNIIKIRPDVLLQHDIYLDHNIDMLQIPHDTKIDISKLSDPDDKHICDIIAYGNTEQMDNYLNFYNSLKELIPIYGTVNETLLYHYLHKNNINYELVEIKYIVVLSLCNIIGITGDSGSGKTTISTIIKKLFDDSSFILECDRYHKWERGDKNWDNYTHLDIEANYITKMQNDVFDLKIGNDIYQVDYDHKTGKFTDCSLIESKDNIIVCGLHTLHLREDIINLKIYMDTDENLRIPWKIKRDIKKRGYTIEKIMDQINFRKKDFESYIYPQREKADIIVNFYTDRQFNLSTFDLEENNRVFLRFGIKDKYEICNVISLLNVKKYEKDGLFWFLYFDEDYDYENIIKTIILQIHVVF